MDRVLDMSILFGLRERPRQVQTYVYTAKTALLHFLCATGSHKVSVLLLRKGWAFCKKVQSAVRKDIGENGKGRVHIKNPSTCKAIYIVKNKQTKKPRQSLAFRRMAVVLTDSVVWQEFNFGKVYSA